MSTKEEILKRLAAGEIDVTEAQRLLGEAERPRGTVYCKVSDKGGVSVYGLGSRFPTTLYVEQWERLLEHTDAIRSFIAENGDRLKRKGT